MVLEIHNKNSDRSNLITCQIYTDNNEPIDIDGDNTVTVKVDDPIGVVVENRGDSKLNIYIVISGEGRYRIDVDLEGILERLYNSCICISPVIIVIFIILVFLKRRNKRKLMKQQEHFARQIPPPESHLPPPAPPQKPLPPPPPPPPEY
jgi:hypothetical protein